MKTYVLILIIVAALLLMGPVMLLFAKLNGVDPFVLDKIGPEGPTPEQQKSFIIVHILRPIFSILWMEARIIKSLRRK